jgi:hypothetical protein
MADEIRHVVSIEANLAKIQTQLKTLEGNFSASFGKISGLAQNLASVLGVSLSIGGAVTATKQILDFADSLQNLHDQTGISVEALSGIKSVVEESGSSLDAFGRGVFNLQKNLGGIDEDSDKAAVAIKALGLNLDALRNASPDDFIKQVSEALAKIENPIQRNTLLFTLLGKSAKELGPVFQQLIGRFEELKSQGVSADTIKAIDDVGDAFTRLKNNMLAVGAEGLANVLRAFGAIRDGAAIAPEIDKASAALGKILNLPTGKIEGLSSKAILDATAAAENKIKQSGATPLFIEVEIAKVRESRDELLNLREEFTRLTKPTEKPKAPFVALPNKKQIDQTQSFLEGLNKQLDGLESKQVGLSLGPQAELGAQLDAAFKEFKDKLAGDKIPIPKGLDSQFATIKERILGANLQLTRMATEMDKIAALGKVLNQDSAEWLNVDEDLAKASDKAKEFRDQLDEIRQGLQLGAIDVRAPGGAATKRIAEIEIQFVETAKKITEIGQKAGASQEQIAADVALAWNKALQDIGIEPDFAALDRELAKISTRAQVFGGTFDGVGASISATRAEIEKLIDQGLDALDPKIQVLNDRLKNLEGVQALRESFENVFDSIEKGLDQTLQGILQGTQSFGEAMKNLARNILLSISNELNKQFILDPLKKALQGFLPNVSGKGSGVFGSGLPTPFEPNIQNFPNVRAPAQLEVPDISGWTIELSDQAGELFDSVGKTISTGLETLTNQSTSGFGGFFSQLGSLISEGLSALSNSESGGGGFDFGGILSSAASWIGSFFEKGGEVKALPHFEFGGSVDAGKGSGVFGPGLPTPFFDGAMPHFATGGEVPAILHEGEFVLQRSAVEKIGLPRLEKMNAGQGVGKGSGVLNQRLPTPFSEGGRVGSLAVNWRSYDTGGMVGAAGGAMSGWGGGKTTVTVNNYGGQPVDVERRKSFDTEEIIVSVAKQMAKNVSRNGDLGRAIGATYALGRAPINRG